MKKNVLFPGTKETQKEFYKKSLKKKFIYLYPHFCLFYHVSAFFCCFIRMFRYFASGCRDTIKWILCNRDDGQSNKRKINELFIWLGERWVFFMYEFVAIWAIAIPNLSYSERWLNENSFFAVSSKLFYFKECVLI